MPAKIQLATDLANCYRGDKREKREFERNTREGLLKSVSKCHDVNQTIIRVIQEDSVEKVKNEKRRFWRAVLIIVISAIAANALKITEAVLWLLGVN